MIEQRLKKLREEMTGYKPMHVSVEGVGSVEVIFMVKLIFLSISGSNESQSIGPNCRVLSVGV